MAAPHSTPPRSLVYHEVGRDVLTRCKAGDPIAFRAFVVRHERAVFALLSRLLGRGPHVEDLAQEAFLRAFRGFPSFDLDGPAKASTWLLTIATRVALDARKRRAVPTSSMTDAAEARAPDTPETERERAELRGQIARAAATLPDDQLAAFVLAELHGFSASEIGEALGIHEGTARTRVHRAREKLKELLGPLLEEK